MDFCRIFESKVFSFKLTGIAEYLYFQRRALTLIKQRCQPHPHSNHSNVHNFQTIYPSHCDDSVSFDVSVPDWRIWWTWGRLDSRLPSRRIGHSTWNRHFFFGLLFLTIPSETLLTEKIDEAISRGDHGESRSQFLQFLVSCHAHIHHSSRNDHPWCSHTAVWSSLMSSLNFSWWRKYFIE